MGICGCRSPYEAQSFALLPGTELSVLCWQERMQQHPQRLPSPPQSRHKLSACSFQISLVIAAVASEPIQALEYLRQRTLIFSSNFGTPVIGSSSPSYSADMYPLYPP